MKPLTFRNKAEYREWLSQGDIPVPRVPKVIIHGKLHKGRDIW